MAQNKQPAASSNLKAVPFFTQLSEAGDEHGFEVGARGIDRGGIAGGTGAEDQQAGVLGSHSGGKKYRY